MVPPPRWSSISLLPFAVALVAILTLTFALQERRKRDAATPDVPGVWATDVAGMPPGSLRLGAQVPAEPFVGQKRPPCEKGLEVAINGGCWIVLKAKPSPTCPGGAFEHRNECVLPVLAAKPRGTALGE